MNVSVPPRDAAGQAERLPVLVVAVALDLLGGEPPNRWHPVAWLGVLAGCLERRAPDRGRARQLAFGAGLTAVLVGGSAWVGALVERALARQPGAVRVLALGAALKPSFSIRGLPEAAEIVAGRLAADNLAGARGALGALVSRPTQALETDQVASAAIESVAENLADSVVAPMLAYLLAGLPGAFAYRAINTLDAMIGYHGRYEDLGKAAARLDDLVNVLPARSSALLLLAAAALGLGDPRSSYRTVRRDHVATESPNAGWPMSAAAGALRVRLEKIGHYELGGEFPAPTGYDIRRAIRLYYAAAGLGVALLMGARLVAARLRPRPEGAAGPERRGGPALRPDPRR